MGKTRDIFKKTGDIKGYLQENWRYQRNTLYKDGHSQGLNL